MIIRDPALILAAAALFSAVARVVWAIGRKP